MWYVVHTKTGSEQDVVNALDIFVGNGAYKRCIIPMFEDVRRTKRVSRISNRKILPGYVLVETEQPRVIASVLKKTRDFATLLSTENEDGEKDFAPIEENDMRFFESIFGSGVMTVSYVLFDKKRRLKKIYGPLAKYGNQIIKLNYRDRRAVVETFVFGKRRRIKFGLWTDEDPMTPHIDEIINSGETSDFLVKEPNVGLHPGDKVRDISGIYGKNEVFLVESVNPLQRKIKASIWILGDKRSIELFIDQVEKI